MFLDIVFAGLSVAALVVAILFICAVLAPSERRP